MNRFDFKVNVVSSTPVYLQLAYVMQRAIELGTLEPDASLPSIRNLCVNFSISKTTAHQAYNYLLERKKIYWEGKGFFVARNYAVRRTAARSDAALNYQA
jgi:DNA-binding transcriptional regulator YhcF (GntR family)